MTAGDVPLAWSNRVRTFSIVLFMSFLLLLLLLLLCNRIPDTISIPVGVTLFDSKTDGKPLLYDNGRNHKCETRTLREHQTTTTELYLSSLWPDNGATVISSQLVITNNTPNSSRRLVNSFFFIEIRMYVVGEPLAPPTIRRHKAVNFEETVKLYLYLLRFCVVKIVNFFQFVISQRRFERERSTPKYWNRLSNVCLNTSH